MIKPAQLSLKSIAVLTTTLVVGGYLVNHAQAQQVTDPAKLNTPPSQVQPSTITPASLVPTPDPLALTTPKDSQLKLTATPVRLGDDNSLLLKPGEKKQVTLKVYNNSKQEVKIVSLAEDFVIGEDGATPQPVDVAESDNRWSLNKWLTIVPNTQTIKDGATGVVSVLIEVPEDALPGGHYAMIMHQPDMNKETANQEDKSTAINQRVGTLLYVVVDGPIHEEAFIRELIIPPFQEFGPVPYSFEIDNDSDIHIQPRLTFNVYNIWGKKVFSEAVNSKNIFPKQSRPFDEGAWERIWGLGRYKGEVVMMYGTQSTTKMLSSFFWLFPLRLVLAIGLGLLALIGMAVAIRRHLIHRKQDQSARVRELEEQVARMEQQQNSETPPQDNG